MKKLNLFLILILFGFGVVVQSAHSLAIEQAPHLGNGPTGTKASKTTGPSHNARLAIAPYAQVVPNNTYTFVGITHPSLSTAHTSIGLVIEAMDMSFTTTASNTLEKARAAIFTISAGQTHRVFIVNEGHATINSENTAFVNANTHLITTSDDSNFGNIRITSLGTHPNEKTHVADRYDNGKTSSYGRATCSEAHASTTTADCIQRYDNLNQLSMWGVVYQESNGAGFSLEFIGDMHDSSAAGTQPGYGVGAPGDLTNIHQHKARGLNQLLDVAAGAGRGVN